MNQVIMNVPNSDKHRPEIENSIVTLSLLNCFQEITFTQAEEINSQQDINVFNPVYRSLLNFENWKDIYNSKPIQELKRDIANLKMKIDTLINPSYKQTHSKNSYTSDELKHESLNSNYKHDNKGIMIYISELIIMFKDLDQRLMHFPVYFIGLMLIYVIVYYLRLKCSGKKGKSVKTIYKHK